MHLFDCLQVRVDLVSDGRGKPALRLLPVLKAGFSVPGLPLTTLTAKLLPCGEEFLDILPWSHFRLIEHI